MDQFVGCRAECHFYHVQLRFRADHHFCHYRLPQADAELRFSPGLCVRGWAILSGRPECTRKWFPRSLTFTPSVPLKHANITDRVGPRGHRIPHSHRRSNIRRDRINGVTIRAGTGNTGHGRDNVGLGDGWPVLSQPSQSRQSCT
jgi:hypothetical protein